MKVMENIYIPGVEERFFSLLWIYAMEQAAAGSHLEAMSGQAKAKRILGKQNWSLLFLCPSCYMG